MAPPPPDPDRFDEAIRAFRRRVPVTDGEMRQMTAAERERAFWVANVTQARMVQEVMDALDRAVASGTTLEDFQAEVGAALAEAWGGPDAPRVEMVFRTNVMGAYNEGREEVFSDPEVRKARPYWRFDTAGDSRVSEDHEELDGLILPADDPWWRSHRPPLRPNCRCQITAITEAEAIKEGVDNRPANDVAAPADGFGRPASRENWEPDLDALDPELRRLVRDRIG